MMALIKTSRLSKHCNPFRENVWDVKVTRKMVAKALAEGKLISIPYSLIPYSEQIDDLSNLYDHASRIAFFIVNEPKDAIQIDVGIPAINYYPDYLVEDGNHRLAAAIYSKKQFVLANIAGQIDYANELFGLTLNDGDDDESSVVNDAN